MLAERLSDWSDAEVAQLSGLMARLRASFDDCRAAHPTSDDPTRTPANT